MVTASGRPPFVLEYIARGVRGLCTRERGRHWARRQSRAAATGLLVDRVLGELPLRPHPVRAFGTAMRVVEARLYRDRFGPGVAHAGIGVAGGVAAGSALGSTAAATYLAAAGRSLAMEATRVARALEDGDLERARSLLPTLVGRDPAGLDEKEIARAAVESVAENTVDAVVSPALWAAVGGARGALGYRAVNTLDAMVGRRCDRYRRYGWASARLDDVAGFVPARVTAGLVMAVRPNQAPSVWHAVRDGAWRHPSPNAGVDEGAFAGALGLRLGGPNRYGDRVELRPALGTGRSPERGDIGRAVRLSRDVTLALAAALALAGGRW